MIQGPHPPAQTAPVRFHNGGTLPGAVSGNPGRPGSDDPPAVHDVLVDLMGCWRLQRGDEVLGEVVVNDSNFPWLTGSWSPTPAFDSVRPLFEAELDLVEDDDLGIEWEGAYRRIWDAGVRLHYPDGRRVPEFLLHIKGDEAWFRWEDEPFHEGGIGDNHEA